MIPCRVYLTFWALSLAFGALVTLAVANRLLLAIEDAQVAARQRAVTRVARVTAEVPVPKFFRVKVKA